MFRLGIVGAAMLAMVSVPAQAVFIKLVGKTDNGRVFVAGLNTVVYNHRTNFSYFKLGSRRFTNEQEIYPGANGLLDLVDGGAADRLSGDFRSGYDDANDKLDFILLVNVAAGDFYDASRPGRSFTYDLKPGDVADISLYYRRATSSDEINFTVHDDIRTNVRLDQIIFGLGSVPESSQWTMMLVGFGGIGFAMRRRTKVTLGLALADRLNFGSHRVPDPRLFFGSL